MTIKIKTPDNGPEKEVTFDFDFRSDTPVGVSQEMVKELHLPSYYIELIQKKIQSLCQRMQGTQAAVSKQKISPVKISKDSAIGHFNKLFESIEGFFQVLQGKGVESLEEVVDAMESTEDEKAFRIEFLNGVYQAKRKYKLKLEEINKKRL